MAYDIEKKVAELNKRFKSDGLFSIAKKILDTPKVPTLSASLNWALYGGFPKNRVIEIAGPEGGGKTTCSFIAIAQYQREYPDEYVGFIDVEHTLDKEWAQKNGVNLDKLVYVDPIGKTAEQIYDIALEMLDGFGLVVIDCVAVMTPQAVAEANMEKYQMCGNAATTAKFFQKLSMLGNTAGTLILLNQVRDDLTNMYNKYKLPGGKALSHGCSLILLVTKGKYLDESGAEMDTTRPENPQGNVVNVRILKTKVCKPDRPNTTFSIKYRTGVDIIGDAVKTGILIGAIQQTGAWYNIVDLETGEILTDESGNLLKFQGKVKLLEYYKTHKEAYKKLFDIITKKISETDDFVIDYDEEKVEDVE